MYGNFTPRSSKHAPILPEYNDHKLTWVGLTGTIKELDALWRETFFSQPWEAVEAAYKNRVAPFTGEENPDASHLEALWNLGYLPIYIKSLPEGTQVPMGVPVFTIVNTLPEFFWLTNYLETHLSAESWHIATAATIAKAYRRVGEKYADLTGIDKSFVDIQFHDFSLRGLSGAIQGAKIGQGHLTYFIGSDNVAAVDWIDYAYGKDNSLKAVSIPAGEHSTATCNILYIEEILRETGEWNGMKLEDLL